MSNEPKGAKRVLYWLGLRKSATVQQKPAKQSLNLEDKPARRSSWVWNREDVTTGEQTRPRSKLGFHRRAQSMFVPPTTIPVASPKPSTAPATENKVSKTETSVSSSLACPLNVVVVGAGIGGLTMAYLLGKAGHTVTILEGSSKLSEVGAGIQLSPNVTRLFERWGVGERLRELGVTPQSLTIRRYENGEVVGWKNWGVAFEKDYGAPYYGMHRADVHGILADLARPHTTIRLSSRVVDIDPLAPSVTLATGEVIKADLIVGADGIHSRVRDTVVGHKDDPTPTGDAAFRATVPVELILADPDLAFLIEDGTTNVWMGPGRHLVGYPIRANKLYNIVMLHPAREDDENVRDASVEDMKAEYALFEPRVRKLLELVPSTMVWSLMDRQPLESWIHSSNKVCLLGDACHPMLPYRAQGAAMAIEDAAVLGNLLSRITSPSELPALLKAYQTLRLPRASATQAASRQNKHIFHLPDGPMQQARDASMRIAMEAALKEARGEPTDDCDGSANLWADRKVNQMAFGYDADEEVEKWCKENWRKETKDLEEKLVVKE